MARSVALPGKQKSWKIHTGLSIPGKVGFLPCVCSALVPTAAGS